MAKFRWTNIIDVDEVQKAISTLKPNNQLFEVRIFGTDKRGAFSGYFTDCDTLITALNDMALDGKSIYISLNKVNDALYSRIQHDQFKSGVNTTSDTEIDRYEWLFIDLDPERPTNISSTDEELAKAEDLKGKVKDYLAELGFPEPIEAASGNGYHLLYRIDLANTQENSNLLNDCLTALAEMFNNGYVKIDTVNYNPSRICKLYGTKAQKGADTASRPHRMSRILTVPEQIIPVEVGKLKALAAEALPRAVAPSKSYSVERQEFDVKEWLREHGLTFREESGRDCEMLLLDECPFDHSHTNGDAKVFAYTNGAIAFKCHHNSCKSYRWQDVRMKFEPDAYDRKDDDERIEAGYKQHKSQKADLSASAEKKPEPKKIQIRKLKRADNLLERDIPEPKTIIGVDNELPLLVEGTCILSAKPKLGKSWFALALCLAVTSGEDFLGYKTQKCSALYLDLETSESIQKKRVSKMLNGRPCPSNFYLETETNNLEHGFVEQIEAYLAEDPDIGVVVVDVFQIIRSEAKNFKESEYDHAYRDITPLNVLAQKHHISIILVCHDRKAVDPDDPFSNILGSTGLQGAASQMMVMFRKRKEDPIHVSVKGKTIDGLIDFNVKLENAEWSIVEGVDSASREREESWAEFKDSPIREAVKAIADNNKMWKGRCSSLIQDAVLYNIAITETAKFVGGFLHRHIGHFLKEDGIQITIIDNGTGAKTYKICKSTVDTVDENDIVPLMDYKDALNIGVPEGWFP